MACRECFSGSLHEGTPVGRVETVHGLETYISEPPSGQTPKGIIVIIPDAFGWTFNNNRILADKLAKRTNSRIYLPEFMAGHVVSVSVFASMHTIMGKGWMVGKILPMMHAISEFVPFMFFNRLAVTKPRIYKFFHDLRTNDAASLPVGAAGYCFGGKFIFLLCSDPEKAANGKSLIDCGFTAHPSNLVIPADANDVTLPLSVAVGDADFAFPLPQVQQVKGMLEERGKDTHEVVIFPGAEHGFAIRAHPEDEKAVEQGNQAEDQAVNWFNRWFGKVAT